MADVPTEANDAAEDDLDLLRAVSDDLLDRLAYAVLWDAHSWGYVGINSDFAWPYDRDREDMSLLEELHEVMHAPDFPMFDDAYAAHLRPLAQAKVTWLTDAEKRALVRLVTDHDAHVPPHGLTLAEVRNAVAHRAVQMMRDSDVQGIKETCISLGLAHPSDLKETA